MNQDDFEATMVRARMKARGLVPRDATPEQADTAAGAKRTGDVGEIIARLVERSRSQPQVAEPEPAPLTQGPRNAAEVRIEWYVPARHRLDVLDVCPAPVATEGLPAGRCACDGVRHFIPQNQTQEVAREAAAEWAERAGMGEGNTLALVGGPGSGKSHLMYAAIRRANLRGINAGAWGWYDLALMLKEAKFARDEESRATAVYNRDRLFSVKAYGVDEIRPTSGTDFDATELSQLMTRAYRECQDVFVTSNFADESLVKIIGLAATSRLTQVSVEGPDYRNPRRVLRAVR